MPVNLLRLRAAMFTIRKINAFTLGSATGIINERQMAFIYPGNNKNLRYYPYTRIYISDSCFGNAELSLAGRVEYASRVGADRRPRTSRIVEP